MAKWLENKFTNCLNYEHTIFLNEPIIEFLLAKNGFEIVQKQYFGEHSIFYACRKRAKIATQVRLEPQYRANKSLICDFFAYYKDKITSLNALLSRTNKPFIFLERICFRNFCSTMA